MTDHVPERASGAQSIERAIGILRIVATAGVVGSKLSDVVSAAKLPRGTVHRILVALVREGLVDQAEDTRLYFLGPETYVFGTIAAQRYGIQMLALPALRRLADVSQDTAFVSIVRGDEVICLQREEGAYPIKTHVLKPGDRHPIGVSSAGQAVLAAMADEQLDRVIAANADAIKQRYPGYPLKLVRSLVGEARRKGFAVNAGFIWPGSWGIAVAVRGIKGEPVGALHIAAVESRMNLENQKELAVHLNRESKWLTEQLKLQHIPRSTPRRSSR
jgi:DNA-binding IclR family transcriptional regulator